MSVEISVRDQIFKMYNNLYDAEKRVADYVIGHEEKVLELSVSQLAEKCDTSQATVIRLCKKIGYTGFHQLKIRLAGEQRKQQTRTISNEITMDNLEQSLHNIMVSKMEEIEATFKNLDREKMKEIIDIILNAATIEFTAMGNTIPVALDGAYKFNQLGLKAVSSTIWETQEAFARTLRKGDVLFAISASGASKTLLRIIDIAKENEVTTIAITNQDQSPLAEACDYTIVTATREHIFHDQVSFTRMAAVSIIDCLFLLLFSTKWDSMKNLEEHEQSVATEKM